MAGEGPLEGVDVAGWQKPMNCDYLRGATEHGLRFVFVKMSQGERVMKSGLAHIAKLIDVNREIDVRNLALSEDQQTPPILIGCYHYADPLHRGLKAFRPAEQADTFCGALEGAGWPWPHALRPMLDMEWKSFGKTKDGKARGARFRRQFPSSQVMEWTRRFNGRVADRLGVMPGVYSGPSYIRYRYRYNADLRFYSLWIASYVGVGPERDHVPTAHERPEPVRLMDGFMASPAVWQFTGRGSVPWYRRGGKIDRDLMLLPNELMLTEVC